MKINKDIGIFLLVFGIVAVAVIGFGIGRSVKYVFILPNDFEGKIKVIKHPEGKDRIESSLFGKKTITVEVPESGMLMTPDGKKLHYMSNEGEWRYRDGRVIKTWPNELREGFNFVGSTGDKGIWVDEDNPLYEWSDGGSVHMMTYEVIKSPGTKESNKAVVDNSEAAPLRATP